MNNPLKRLAIYDGILEIFGEDSPVRPYRGKQNGFTGKEWEKRKSRSKLAKQSRKKNR